MKLLLVEDSSLDVRLLRETLKEAPAGAFELAHATRLATALKRLSQETFDLVLLDLGLPDSQGAESVARMHLACPALPIIVLTGLDDPQIALEAVRAGAQDCLVKGRFDAEVLTRAIRYAVERKRAAEELRQLNAELERRVEERTAELSASEERFRQLFERHHAVMLLIDPASGAIIDANSAASSFYGFSHDELCASHIQEINDLSQEEVAVEMALAAAEERNFFVFPHRLANGQRRWVEVYSTPVEVRGRTLLYSIIHDVTLKEIAEQEQRRLLHELNVHKVQLESQNGELRSVQHQLDVSRAHYVDLFDLAPIGYVTLNAAGVMLEVNHTAATMLDVGRSSLVQRPLVRFIHPDDQDRHYFHHKRLLETAAPQLSELRMLKPDGTVFWVQLESTLAQDIDGNPVDRIALSDISERKRQETELLRLNRTLRALNASGNAQLLAQTEGELLFAVCRIISKICGYALIWIGYAEENAAKSVRPMAYAGFEDGYLESLRISWADNKFGRGPTGTAIRNGQPSTCSNMLTDPDFAPWRGEARKRGCNSSLAVPLRVEGKVIGAVTLYSEQPAGFPHDEVKLLAELAGDLSYGITMLRLREAQQRAETALRESEAGYRMLVEQTVDGIFVADAQGHYVDVNPAGAEMLGYSREEVLDRSVSDMLAEEEIPRLASEMASMAGGNVACNEWQFKRKDGSLFVGEFTGRQLADGRLQGVLRDVTERKQAEEQIRQLNAELERRVLDRTAELRKAVTALETEFAERQRLEREILEISEREQSRLGQDLHDGIGQELAGTAMFSDVLARQLQAEAHPLADSAAAIAAYIRATIESARRLAKGLYPIELNRYGLLLALKSLADQTSHRTGIRCELQRCGEAPPMPRSAEIHIYRIMQECVSNAVKHGKANHILIESLAGDGTHTFTVTDDGVGFAKPAGSSGMGLHLMEYRARVIGATIDIEQPARGGCRVTCRLAV